MKYNDIKLEDYKPHSIGYWPQFTSTSKDFDSASGFSFFKSGMDGQCLVFKIFLNNRNYPVTNIDFVGGEWSMFENEQEVLLFPYFAF